jgi:hypothetical protein
MLGIVRQAVAQRWSHLEMVLHSSELMPGASPSFADARSIEALYRDLRVLFRSVSAHFRGLTLMEFAQQWRASHEPADARDAAMPRPMATGVRA